MGAFTHHYCLDWLTNLWPSLGKFFISVQRRGKRMRKCDVATRLGRVLNFVTSMLGWVCVCLIIFHFVERLLLPATTSMDSPTLLSVHFQHCIWQCVKTNMICNYLLMMELAKQALEAWQTNISATAFVCVVTVQIFISYKFFVTSCLLEDGMFQGCQARKNLKGQIKFDHYYYI